MGIISGLGSFRGQFEDHFRVGDNFGVGIISGAVQASLENWREKSLRVSSLLELKYTLTLSCRRYDETKKAFLYKVILTLA